MLLPVFVKGHLSFKADNRSFDFTHLNISVFGVTGLPWGPLNAHDHFGREVLATLRIPAGEPMILQTRAYIMREYTNRGEHMGLKFQPDETTRARLSAHIQKVGGYPSEYLRKYPRIPADNTIQTFPLRVLYLPGEHSPTQGPIIFDVGNLSPNGILIHTENQAALDLKPGMKLELMLEPRGWFPMQIRVQGLICRIVDELHLETRNPTRYLGIKFARVDEVNRTAFLDLLRDILSRIKQRNP